MLTVSGQVNISQKTDNVHWQAMSCKTMTAMTTRKARLPYKNASCKQGEDLIHKRNILHVCTAHD